MIQQAHQTGVEGIQGGKKTIYMKSFISKRVTFDS